ncbi:hypothetical protein ACFL06_00125 [Patescibacteria group bacterium]
MRKITFIGISLLFLLSIPSFSEEIKADSSDNVSGWAWSENIGWISFNCEDMFSCPSVNYGVDVNLTTTGNFTGYAWSENIGWINFDPAQDFVTYPGIGYPELPDYTACLDVPEIDSEPCDGDSSNDNKVSGWARACAGAANPAACDEAVNPESGGWDGWIKLKGGSAAATNTIVSVDTDDDVGLHTSIALDGNIPVISYYDVTYGDLMLARCDDADCTSAQITPVDTGGDVGQYTSLVLNGSNPVISYYDVTNGDLKIAICSNPTCTIKDIVSLDQDTNVGQYTSVALGTLNIPRVSYYDVGNTSLKLAVCTTVDCSGVINTTPVDNTGDVGRFTSMVLGGGDAPRISYQAGTTLKVVKCNDPMCVGGGEVFEVVRSALAGYSTSIALDSGVLIISYIDLIALGNTRVYVARNEAGSGCDLGSWTCNLVYATGDASFQPIITTSIDIDAAGKPAISVYNKGAFRELAVVKCDDEFCSSSNVKIVDTTGSVGGYSSLVLDGDNPVVSYYDVTNGNLKLARCGAPDCEEGAGTTTFEVVRDEGEDPDELKGWAWGSDVMGWISFNCTDTGSCLPAPGGVDYAVFIGDTPSSFPPEVTNMSLGAVSWCNPETYKEGEGRMEFLWTYDDLDGQHEYRWEFRINDVDEPDPADLNDLEVNRTYPEAGCIDQHPTVDHIQPVKVLWSPTGSGDELEYDTNYYWWVRGTECELGYDGGCQQFFSFNPCVEGNNSGWVKGPDFRTPDRPYPYPSFICDGVSTCGQLRPAENEEIELKDASETFFAPLPIDLEWTFIPPSGKSVTVINDSPPEPYTADPLLVEFPQGNTDITLRVIADGNPCSITQTLFVPPPLPEWKEIHPNPIGYWLSFPKLVLEGLGAEKLLAGIFNF